MSSKAKKATSVVLYGVCGLFATIGIAAFLYAGWNSFGTTRPSSPVATTPPSQVQAGPSDQGDTGAGPPGSTAGGASSSDTGLAHRGNGNPQPRSGNGQGSGDHGSGEQGSGSGEAGSGGAGGTAPVPSATFHFDDLGGGSSIINVYPGVADTQADHRSNGTFNSGDDVPAQCKITGRTVDSVPSAGEKARESSTWIRINGTPGAVQYAPLTYGELSPSVDSLPDC